MRCPHHSPPQAPLTMVSTSLAYRPPKLIPAVPVSFPLLWQITWGNLLKERQICFWLTDSVFCPWPAVQFLSHGEAEQELGKDAYFMVGRKGRGQREKTRMERRRGKDKVAPSRAHTQRPTCSRNTSPLKFWPPPNTPVLHKCINRWVCWWGQSPHDAGAPPLYWKLSFQHMSFLQRAHCRTKSWHQQHKQKGKASCMCPNSLFFLH